MRAVAARVAALGCDAAIAVQRSLRPAVTLALAGIPLRVGFAGAPGALLYHHRVAQRGAHARDRLVALARPFGVAPRPLPLPELVADPAARVAVDARLSAAGVGAAERLLVVAPGAAWETKRWPAGRFAEAAYALVPGVLDRVVVVGTAADRLHAATIAAAVARDGVAPPVVDLAGRTSTAELVAVLARASLVLVNDSAPGHVAAALRRPVVSLFGPTVPAQGFAPLGARVRIAQRRLSCRPCSRHGGSYCPIGTHECLADLPAATVVAAAQDLLAHERRAAPALGLAEGVG
jgi:heptosyltransferase-2